MKEIDWSKAPEGATHYNYYRACPWLRDGERPAYFHNGEWVEYPNPDFGRADIKNIYSVPRPAAAPAVPAWDGTGLPPVGTVCEALISGGWYRGTVIGHCVPPRESFAAFQGDGLSDLIFGSSEYFRPLHTPDQIAAEEREKAVDEMMAAHEPWIATRRFCEKLYDAGYRRQEPKE